MSVLLLLSVEILQNKITSLIWMKMEKKMVKGHEQVVGKREKQKRKYTVTSNQKCK